MDAAPEEAKLIHTARNVNDYKPMYVVEKVKEKANRFKNPVIACLGLAFKANIDDLRESPALEIVKKLAGLNVGEVIAVEPHVNELPDSLKDEKITLLSVEDAMAKSDIILVLVDHEIFGSIDFDQLKEKVVIDTKGFIK